MERFSAAHRSDKGILAIVFRGLLLSLLLIVLIVATSAQESTFIISAGMTSEGIPTLLGPDGRTLYTFTHDEGGESVCYDQCAEAWPPVFIDAAIDPGADEGVPGQLGTTEREDGSHQVTYNGWPLYYYFEDAAPGDAKGQGLEDVWFAANPATVMVSHKEGLGDILVGPGGFTLYVFLEDAVENGEGESYCYEECEVAWPALIVPGGKEPSLGAGVPGQLGLTERRDGSRQVTYNGWPLYFFKADRSPGDTTGNAIKDVWYVAMAEAAPDVSLSVNTELVAEGLAAPVAFVSANDGTGRMFIADQAGMIRILDSSGQLLDTPFLDLTGQIVGLNPGYDERGLLGLAFHPDYANNGRFFVYYTAPLRPEAPADWDHTNIVAEISVSADDANRAELGTLRYVLSIDQPQFNHDAGQITFGPDGYLYIPIGDGGGGNDTGLGHTPDIGNAQDTSNLHGNILRIDVDGEIPYSIPADNPFVGEDGIADEIFAYGLRNPFRIAFDNGGRLFVADAGQELFEEVSIVTTGGNYGWNIKEGTHCFDPDAPEQPPASCPDTDANGTPLTDPIIEYDHRYGNVVVGGSVYEGSALPELSGYYIFGSYTLAPNKPNGRLFAAMPSSGAGELWQFTELEIANGEGGKLGAYTLSFGEDQNGEIYVLSTESSAPFGDTGKVWRLMPASSTDESPTTEESPGSETAAEGETDIMVSAGTSSDGIPTLVGPDGRTLYTFAHDDEGESTCYGGCAEAWPPLIIAEGVVPSAGEGIPGELATVARTDGSSQVTYNGWPLYYYSEDEAEGDANGQGEADVWFAANPAAVMLSADDNTLVGPGGLTLYIFTEDHADESYCYEECAVAWPPLVVEAGMQPLMGADVSGELGLTERADGEMQVTYNGWPLYFFRGDRQPGDKTGHGLKEVWFVATVDQSQAPSGDEQTPISPTAAPPASPTALATQEPTIESPTSEMTDEVTVEAPTATETATGEVTEEPTSVDLTLTGVETATSEVTEVPTTETPVAETPTATEEPTLTPMP